MESNVSIGSSGSPENHDRRSFIGKSALWLAGLATAATAIPACGGEKGGDDDVTTNEDLMREHGVLKRVLIIYDEVATRISTGKDVDFSLVGQSANLIKTFIEDYHEKLEEDHLFPRFEKAGKLVDLVKTLRLQHQKGRIITQRLIQLCGSPVPEANDKIQIASYMMMFNRMYSPHEAREDTVLFPALHKLISKHEYDSLGELFEKKERQQFGGDGFDMAVDKVTAIEKGLDLYDLNQFTPEV